jgi:pimeloyl-ACP methyl ester carboxylesterase
MTYHPLVKVGEGLAAREAAGAGDAVFWVHPYGLDSSCWEDLWALLPEWRHVGIDLPGHGSSLPLGREETLSSLAGRLADAAVARGARHLVSLSLGALFAQQMAVERPGAFSTIVLASPLVDHGANDDLFWKRYRELVNMYRMAGHGEYLRGRLMLVEPSPFETVAAHRALWDRLWAIVGRHPFWDLGDAAMARLGEQAPSDVALHAIEAPVLLVTGERERAPAKRHADRLQNALTDCRRYPVLGTGSHSLLEAPGPAAAAIGAHLRGASSDALPARAGGRA